MREYGWPGKAKPLLPKTRHPSPAGRLRGFSLVFQGDKLETDSRVTGQVGPRIGLLRALHGTGKLSQSHDDGQVVRLKVTAARAAVAESVASPGPPAEVVDRLPVLGVPVLADRGLSVVQDGGTHRRLRYKPLVIHGTVRLMGVPVVAADTGATIVTTVLGCLPARAGHDLNLRHRLSP